jgi:glycine/D-amino acid oxidase-like deaminating enzyme
MTQSPWQKPIAASAPWECDVAIVGGGLAGLSLAYWLTQKSPRTRITVIEAESIGAGASGRNAGFNTAGSTFYLAQLVQKYGATEAAAYWDFKQDSLRLMREHLFARFQVDQQFWGSTTLYRDEAQRVEHHELLSSIQVAGLSVVQDTGFRAAASGLRFTQEGCLHPVKLLESLAAHLMTSGVQFITGQAVAWGESDANGVRLVCSRSSGLAQHVFLALNGYAGQFHPSLAEWVSPKRAQMVALDVGERRFTGNFYDPAHKVYFRQDAQTKAMLVGGMRLIDEAQENSEFDKTTATIQTALQRYMEEMLAGPLTVAARWSGVMGFTAEERPYVRAVPFLKNTTFVGGFSGHGMGLAFGTAHEAVARFLGHATRFADILPRPS